MIDSRVGRCEPRTVIATRIKMTGSASRKLPFGRKSGSQSARAWNVESTLWDIPIASPAMVVAANPFSPPSSAAAKAGTTNRLVSIGSSLLDIPAIAITASPASTDAIAQFRYPSRSGDKPVRTAPFSCSAAARVARPKRVNRNTSARPTATAIAIPASTKLAVGIVELPRWTTPSGSKEVSCNAAAPPPSAVTRNCMTDCRYRNTPNDATMRASGGAARRGRKTNP